MKIGDLVRCRLYNKPEGKSYGDYWDGKLLDIQVHTIKSEIWYLNGTKETMYLVEKPNHSDGIWLHRNEVKGVVKNEKAVQSA